MKSFNPKGILIAAAAAAAVAGGAQAADISGAGATFPYPIYSKWADAYKRQTGWGSTISRSVGGWHQADQGKDGHLWRLRHAAEAPGCQGGRLGAVPHDHRWGRARGEHQGCGAGADGARRGDRGFNLSRRDQQWNDPRIKKLNPKLALPDTAIAPVYRSDGSGTNFLFSDYLSKASRSSRRRSAPQGSNPLGNDQHLCCACPSFVGMKRHHPQTFRAFP